LNTTRSRTLKCVQHGVCQRHGKHRETQEMHQPPCVTQLRAQDSRTLDVLRQPVEDKTVQRSRAAGSMTFPARFMLIAAMNPCKCGWHGDPTRPCTCPPAAIQTYQKKLSGPLLDCIDIHLHVHRMPYAKLSDLQPGESSDTVRGRVQTARDRQAQRSAASIAAACNADMIVTMCAPIAR
jgi:magnesium chelatase family protein